VAVVLLDLSLPDSQGFDTFRRVRAAAPDVPVVVLSGLQDERMAARAVREGAQDYLVKGQVDGQLLARSLRYAIERRRAEEQRARLIQEQAARAEAEAAVRVREEFLSAAAHDLRGPLTAIKGLAQLLHRRATRTDSEEARQLAEGLERIDVGVGKMQALIDELLDVTALQLGRPLLLKRQPTDLVALTRQLAAEQQLGAPRHQIRFEATVPELVGDWDAARLERVLANLIGNAVKYSPSGGEVVVRVAEATVGDQPGALVQVADRGVGIPAADLPRIFERFQRGSNVEGKIAGTGIGLAGGRQIVQQHGGTIEVESRENVGSTFTVRLPLAPPVEGAEEPSAPAHTGSQ
jgi:signal transduction histidine kinase